MKPTDKQVVEWARKAGVANAWDINWFDPYYASFADLAYKAGAAAEREKFCFDLRGLHDVYSLQSVSAIRAGGNHE
jgi:hypothetical protein